MSIFFDNNVDLTMNIFLIIANIINLIYNIPQIIKTYKTKSTGDFSKLFISLRIIGNIIWLVYAIQIKSIMFIINNVITILSSIFIGYYMIINYYKDKYEDEEEDISIIIEKQNLTNISNL